MRLILLAFMAVVLSSCQSTRPVDQRIEQYIQDPEMKVDDAHFDQNVDSMSFALLSETGSFLSTKARENLKKLVAKRSEMRKKILAVCGITAGLSEQDKERIAKIKADASLSKEEKATQLKSIISPMRENMMKSRDALKTCQRDQKDKLRPLLEKRAALKKACMISYKAMANDDKKPAHEKKILSAEQKVEQNAKLESAECTAALAK